MDSNSDPNLSSSSSSSRSPSFRKHTISSIPFSWERQPGIPKSLSVSSASGEQNLLPLPPPLPPPLKSVSRIPPKKRFENSVDPFTAALVECAKEIPDVDSIWWRRSDQSGESKICRSSVMPDRLGFLHLFASFSCKASCSVSDANTIAVPRSRIRSAQSYGFLDRRSN